ncbi:MAG: efflux RND transporter periplasmic adaptor subunit [Steroidobacteraceae bacterium]|nr:efflux RND transporter periplasmic adaptor subunit [Steroidobacteraceae bacterium]
MNARPLLPCLLAAVLAACGGAAPDTAAAPTPVRVATAFPGPAIPAIATNGIVAAKDEMRLSFLVGGVVRRIAVEEGARIRRGQELAALELTEVDAQVEQAAQLAAKAQRDLERGERLYADQVISLEQLQDLRTQASVAQAQASSARFSRAHATIRAPHDGVVLRKLVQERETVAAGAPVLVVSGEDRGYVVRVALADREIVPLRLGDPAEVRLDAYPARAFAGRVAEISAAADPASGLFPVEVSFDAPPAGLASGLVAKLTIHPAAGDASTLVYVPIAAIVEGNRERASVYVVEDGHARRREVGIAFIAADGVALAGGVASGETVITDGALYVGDGDAITIVDEAAQAIGGTAPAGRRG